MSKPRPPELIALVLQVIDFIGLRQLVIGAVIGVIGSIWSVAAQLPAPVVFAIAITTATSGAVLALLVSAWWERRHLPVAAGTPSIPVPEGQDIPTTSFIPPHNRAVLEQVINRTFENVTVVLDGKSYVGCTFRHCIFVYNGGYYELIHCTYQGSRAFTTANVGVKRCVELLNDLGHLRNEVPIRSLQLPEHELP